MNTGVGKETLESSFSKLLINLNTLNIFCFAEPNFPRISNIFHIIFITFLGALGRRIRAFRAPRVAPQIGGIALYRMEVQTDV